MGFFDALKFSKLKEGLNKTRENLVSSITKLISATGKIDENFLEQLEEIFIRADVGAEATQTIIENIKKKVKEVRYETQEELQTIIREQLASIFVPNKYEEEPLTIPEGIKPYVIMVVGVNGAGKTTTIGKLANRYKEAGKEVFIGAADTFRAAANEQLEVWAQRAGVKIIQQKQGSDPAAVAFDTVQSAQSKNADVVIIDTAGRLHTKTHLMEELKKIKRAIQKSHSTAPHEILLVLDSTTGQNALQQAKLFNEVVGVTGLILTKLDGTAKGGIVFAVSRLINVPVRYIGVGEQMDDLQPFNSKKFVEALFSSSS